MRCSWFCSSYEAISVRCDSILCWARSSCGVNVAKCVTIAVPVPTPNGCCRSSVASREGERS